LHRFLADGRFLGGGEMMLTVARQQFAEHDRRALRGSRPAARAATTARRRHVLIEQQRFRPLASRLWSSGKILDSFAGPIARETQDARAG
jgi:hypothetical protein